MKMVLRREDGFYWADYLKVLAHAQLNPDWRWGPLETALIHSSTEFTKPGDSFKVSGDGKTGIWTPLPLPEIDMTPVFSLDEIEQAQRIIDEIS